MITSSSREDPMSKKTFIVIALGGILVTAVQAPGATSAPAVLLYQVEDTVIRDYRAAEGTGTFILFSGELTKHILLERNDFRKVRLPYSFASGASAQALKFGD
jgi:hypothetical protein